MTAHRIPAQTRTTTRTTGRRTARTAAPLTVGALLACLLTACGGDQPAICDQADQLRASTEQLKNTTLSENGLGSFTTALGQVRSALVELRDAAGTQYASQIDAVQFAAQQVQGRVAEARVDPTAAAIGQVGVALGQLQTTLASLRQALAGTC